MFLFYVPYELLPKFVVTPSISPTNEGTTVTFNITSTNFDSGTIYYTNSGTTYANDFTDGINSGSISIVNSVGHLTKTLSNDTLTEGNETIVIQLRMDSINGQVVSTSGVVNINDTSKSPPTYSISTNGVTAVDEGGSIAYSVTTTDFGSGTLYYTNSGTSASADFTDSTNSGSISVTNDAGTLTKTLVNDLLTE
jgi:hypothetical protein